MGYIYPDNHWTAAERYININVLLPSSGHLDFYTPSIRLNLAFLYVRECVDDLRGQGEAMLSRQERQEPPVIVRERNIGRT